MILNLTIYTPTSILITWVVLVRFGWAHTQNNKYHLGFGAKQEQKCR